MDILDYREKIVEFKPIPKDFSVYFAALGLCGESAEVVEKYQNYTRIAQIKIVDELTRDSIAKELGDVLWYMTRIIDELDIDNIKEGELEHPIFSFLTDPSLVATNLQLKAGQIAEICKKTIRDKNGFFTKEDKIIVTD